MAVRKGIIPHHEATKLAKGAGGLGHVLPPLKRTARGNTAAALKSARARAANQVKLNQRKSNLVWQVYQEVMAAGFVPARKIDLYRKVEAEISSRRHPLGSIKATFVENVIRNEGEYVQQPRKPKKKK
jgi:hypothetical protein